MNAPAARSFALDILRVTAVLLVLGRHLYPPAGDEPSWLAGLLRAWRRGGWVGVDLFFVLSGFLVAGLLFKEYLKERTFSVGRFYLRRGLKIYPAFFAFLLVALLVEHARGKTVATGRVLAEVLFLQSYLPHSWQHTWSLAVEEHFYLLLPLLLLLLARWRGTASEPFRALVPTFIVLSVGLLLLRVANATFTEFSHQTHLFPTHLRLDSLCMGVMVSYWYHFRRAEFERLAGAHRRPLILGGLVLLSYPFVLRMETTPWIYTLGFTLFYVGGAALLAGTLVTPIRANWLTRPLSYLGARSYSIYLWHVPVLLWTPDLLQRITGQPPPFMLKAAVYLAGSCVLGIIAANMIELPVVKLRDRWFPSRTASPVDNAPTPDAVNQSSTLASVPCPPPTR